jgi:hypothetical protein
VATVATVIVHGGWQAVAAALAIFSGGAFVLTLAAIRAAAERPRSSRPSWAVAEEGRPVHLSPAGLPPARKVAAPDPGAAPPAAPVRRPLAVRQQRPA